MVTDLPLILNLKIDTVQKLTLSPSKCACPMPSGPGRSHWRNGKCDWKSEAVTAPGDVESIDCCIVAGAENTMSAMHVFPT